MWGCTSWLPSKDDYMESRERKIFRRRNPRNTASAGWSRLTSPLISPIDNIYSWYDRMTIAFNLCDFPSKSPLLKFNLEWHMRFPIEGILRKAWIEFFEVISMIKTREILRPCHGAEEPEETWGLNVMRSLGWNLEHQRGYYGRTTEIWMKCGP